MAWNGGAHSHTHPSSHLPPPPCPTQQQHVPPSLTHPTSLLPHAGSSPHPAPTQVTFDPPAYLKLRGEKELSEWWAETRRLSFGSLLVVAWREPVGGEHKLAVGEVGERPEELHASKRPCIAVR